MGRQEKRMSWLDKFKKSNKNITIPELSEDEIMSSLTSNPVWSSSFNVAATAVATPAGSYTVAMAPTAAIAGAVGGQGANVQYGIGSGMFSSSGTSLPTNIITFHSQGKEIVKVNLDGSVTWANGIDVDSAAEAFARTLSLGAEQKAGISKRVKLEMRDSVFEDLIEIAKEKGSLTAEDLTYLLSASKIVEKLKG
jgi:hypothetical protein